jgi:cell division protein FtsA
VSFAQGRQLLNTLAHCGGATAQPDGHRRIVEIDGAASRRRRIPVSAIEQIIEARLEELLQLVADDLRTAGALPKAAEGAVLCGGGARIPGILKMAKDELGIPVRTGGIVRARLPAEAETPEDYVVPVGMIRYGQFMLQVSQPEQPSLLEQIRHDLRKARDVVRKAFPW